MRNIVLTGITGYRNRGVEALVTTKIKGLHDIYPDVAINVLSETPDYDSARSQQNHVLVSADGFRSPRLGHGVKKMVRQLTNRYPEEYLKSVQQVQECDAVIASGGDCFSSDYGDLSGHLLPLRTAQKLGKKTVFLGQSIGPFKTKQEADIWTEVALKSDLITVRESLSYKYLTEVLHIPKNKVALTADVAFLLSPPSPEKLEQLAAFYHIDRSKPIIAMSISQGIKKFAGVDSERHFEAWKQIIRTAVEDIGAQVVIVPHVQERWASNDDKIIASALARELDYNPMIKVLSGDHSAGEYKGIIGMADLVLAERMHAAIAGLSSGVSTVAVAYSVKAFGIMNDLLGQQAQEQELVLPVQDFIKKKQLDVWLKEQWKRREGVSEKLQSQMNPVKRLAFENYERVRLLG